MVRAYYNEHDKSAAAWLRELIKDEMREARYAEADLDAAKKHLDTLQAILSSVQTRAKLATLEMSLAR